MAETNRSRGLVALESSAATIATTTVTIKALKVNNRQLPQAVFRQLEEGQLVDEEKVELRGLPIPGVGVYDKDWKPIRSASH